MRYSEGIVRYRRGEMFTRSLKSARSRFTNTFLCATARCPRGRCRCCCSSFVCFFFFFPSDPSFLPSFTFLISFLPSFFFCHFFSFLLFSLSPPQQSESHHWPSSLVDGQTKTSSHKDSSWLLHCTVCTEDGFCVSQRWSLCLACWNSMLGFPHTSSRWLLLATYKVYALSTVLTKS